MSDTDGDGLTDGQEVNIYHTNPKLADTVLIAHEIQSFIH